MFSLLLIGFLIGMRHTLEADHVAAVATLASDTHSLRSAVKHGAIWGIGHTLALFAFGSFAILNDSIIPSRLADTLEMAVGIMLILLGADVIRKILRDRVHFHTHRHADGKQHFHAHKHRRDSRHYLSNHQHSHHAQRPAKALFIGLMHGMAGSAALILLTLQTVQSTAAALWYMLLFGLGSIIGMASLSIIIAIPIRHSARTLTWMNNGIQAAIGIFSLALGGSLFVSHI